MSNYTIDRLKILFNTWPCLFCSDSGEMCAMKEVTLFSDDAKSKESAKQLAQVSLSNREQSIEGLMFVDCLELLIPES